MNGTARRPHRVLHLTDDFSAANTGVSATLRQIAQWQGRHCDWVGVHATGPGEFEAPVDVELLRTPAHPLARRWRWPEGGVGRLLELVRAHRVTHLHVHEFWRGAYVGGMLAARRAALPVVLSAHGATAPWALDGQGRLKALKKRGYWNGFARHLLAPRAALHAITPLEREHMRRFFGRDPEAVVPNAVDEASLPRAPDPQTVRRQFVFLGRLHPVKGIDVLLEAFERAALDADWELVVAGPEEVPAFAAALRAQAARGSRAARIRFAGPLYGQDKAQLLAGAWAVVVPSHTEVIGMVNLEAACAATPTITTPHTGLAEWEQAGGLLAGDDPASLAAALEAAARWTRQERASRGEQLRGHVRQHYSLDRCGQRWLELYDRMASR